MSDPLVVVDSSKIREGKLEELKSGLVELAEFVEANEAAPLAYEIYFDENDTLMTCCVMGWPSMASSALDTTRVCGGSISTSSPRTFDVAAAAAASI